MKKNTKSLDEKIPKYRINFTTIIIFMVFLGIFAVRIHVEFLKGRSLEVFPNSNGVSLEWFLYCKEILYFIISCVICAYSLGERIYPDKPCRINPITDKKALPLLICVVFYLVMSIISALFSENKDVVLLGICTEYEGLTAIFSYCILFLFGFNFINGKEILSMYKKALAVIITFSSALAIFEYSVMPVMKIPFMKYLAAPQKYREIAAGLVHRNDFREAVLMFYNSNYSGVFFAFVLPVSVYFVISSDKTIKKVLSAILSVSVFVSGIMTNSTASLYVMITELLFLFIILAIKKIITPKQTGITIGVFLIAVIGLNFATGNAFLKNIYKSFTNEGAYISDSKSFDIERIDIEGKKLHITAKNSEYYIIPPFEKNQVLEVTGIGNTIYNAEKSDYNVINVHDVESNKDFNVKLVEGILSVDFGFNCTFDFAVSVEGLKAIVQNQNLISEIPASEFAGSRFTKYYSMATGRGYIWLNTLPILRKCLLIGRGAGNFSFNFPQNDIVGICLANGTYHIVVDKPHSMYLQIAVSSGIPALLAVIFIFVSFVYLGFRKLIGKKEISDELKLFICLYTGICGYMIMGLANDSTVAVSPFFWLNFGAAYCMLLKQNHP